MTPREPERLRVSASEIERRALAHAAGEIPPPEVIGRVARALGVSAAAVDAATRASATSTSVATAKGSASTGASASTAATIPWGSIGVLGVVIAGAIVGVGMWRASAPAPSSPAPAKVMPAAPSVAPSPEASGVTAMSDDGKANAAPAAPAADRAPPPTTPRRSREAAALPDSRGQTLLVDSARNALTAGSVERSLVLLAKYREKYPNGIFLPEVVVLKIEALARLGLSSEAHALAARFAADYGEGPLAERARRVADLPRP
jgi:hypothetical protein